MNEKMRSGLLALVVITLAPAPAKALGERERLQIAQIAYAGNWNPRPSALRRLAWEVDKRTSVEAAGEPAEVRLSDEVALRRYPLLFLSGERALPAMDDGDVGRLRRHLLAGGMLVVDGGEGPPGGEFDGSVRALARRLFPTAALERLPAEHVIYKSFYLLKTPVGRVAAVPYLEAVIVDGRAVMVYSQNDMAGAWARDNFGQWEHEVYPGGDIQREMAFRLGINLVMYALCTDYKTDQVHVPFILRRRQWQSK
jgi:hypothetical protein